MVLSRFSCYAYRSFFCIKESTKALNYLSYENIILTSQHVHIFFNCKDIHLWLNHVDLLIDMAQCNLFCKVNLTNRTCHHDEILQS